jgi:long-chain acyl-CoA synthetase
MTYDSWPNLATMFFERMAEIGDGPFLSAKRDGEWRAVSGNDAAAQAASLAGALRAMGISPGDRVMLVSENRPEWAIADLGIMAAGAITVPAYVTNRVNDHLHVMTDSGAKAVIVSTPALAEIVREAAQGAPDMETMILIDGDSDDDALSWNDLLAAHPGALDAVAGAAKEIKRSETACLIYTSGTGGVPKGVMLSHGAIISNCKGARDVLQELGLDDEKFLSFLPLSHSYEHTAGLMFPISIGAQICYAESVDKLAANMAEVSPTILTCVPRLYENMHSRILRGVDQSGGLSAKLFHKAVEIGIRKYHNDGRLGIGARLADVVLEKLVRDKVRQRFGGRLKAMVSGGAPLNFDIGLFFTALGLRLMQGYGQTESAPVISCNPPHRIRIDTVGPPMTDVEVRLAEDGEILVRGELVMQGYWRNQEATDEVIRDGWLHTGDIGEFDDDSYIRITDRKKDIIVNTGGDNVSPQRIEGILTLQPEIAQSMVYGDRKPHLVALIVPDPDFVRDWAAANNKPGDVAALIDDTDFRAAIQSAIDRVNDSLSVIEKIRRIEMTAQSFTIENELMTPSLKIRRHKINEIHGVALENLYGR